MLILRNLLCILIFILGGCAIREKEHGYDFELSELKKIHVNKSTKEEVLNILGSPSAQSSVDSNTWYYGVVDTKNIVIFRPKIHWSKLLQIDFKNNRVSHMMMYDGNTEKSLDFANTDSKVDAVETNTFKDLVKNMGRFNKTKKK